MSGASDDQTFLFTDIEGSTQHWEAHGDQMRRALAHHDELVVTVVTEHHGSTFKQTGDGVCAVFAGPVAAGRAVAAAISVQRQLRDAAWGDLGELRVRVGLHCGPAELRDGDYFGPTLNRVARIMGSASGGQIVASASVVDAVDGAPDGATFIDLGWHRFKGLSRPEHVFHVDAPGLVAFGDLPPILSLNPVRGNLPARDAALIGREREVTEISDLLSRSRTVTLVGPPGVGKTSIGVEAAWRELGRYPDGVVYVGLAALTPDAGIDDAVLSALGAEPQGESRRDALLVHLRDRRLLLVLDNCEHVAAPVAALVTEILASCRNVTVLSTSRRRLGVAGESSVDLEPLNVEPGGAAEELFWDRARAASPALTTTAENRAAVSAICRKLDGIPLALELAATRLSVVTPVELEGLLAERFRLLSDDSTQRSDRQRTLRATVDWSFDLLDESDQRLLTTLSVFAGGCDRAAVSGVSGLDSMDTIGALSRLAQNSLVRVDQSGATPRYWLLETVREYGHERLAEAGTLETPVRAHASWFRTLSERAREALRGPAEMQWVETIFGDFANLRSALENAIERGDLDTAASLVGNLYPFEVVRWSEVARWAGQVLAMPGVDDHPLAMELHVQWATDALFARDAPRIIERCRAGLTVAERQGRATGGHIWSMLASAHILQWEWEDVVRDMASGVAAARDLGDPYDLAGSLSGLAVAEFYSGQEDQAMASAEECVRQAALSGSPAMMANAAGTWGTVLMHRDPARARTLLVEGLAGSEAARSTYHRIIFPRNLALLEWQCNNPLRAVAHLMTTLEVTTQFGDRSNFVNAANLLVHLLTTLGADASATAVVGSLDNENVSQSESEMLARSADLARERLGADRFDGLRATGQSMAHGDLLAWLAGTLHEELPVLTDLDASGAS